MQGVSKAIFIGRLTRDPEVKNVGDQPLASFGIAVNRKFKGEEAVSFYDIDAWGKLAESIGQFAKQSDVVYLECRMKVDNFEDKQGQRRSKVRFTATSFNFLPGGAPKTESLPKDKPQTNDETSTEEDVPF